MTRRHHRPSVSALVVLSVVWVLLWDTPTPLVVVSGLVVAVAVTVVFPLPRIERAGRVRPIGLIRLVVKLLADVIASSVIIVRLAFRFGHTPRAAIIRVQLRSRSDLYLTQTAELVSLVPGTIVVEARRATSTLYLHVFGAVSDADLRQSKDDVLAAEARVIRAFGSVEEIHALGRPIEQEPNDG